MDFENLCPGCMREVENRSQMKYCPHCGYDLGNMQAAPHQLQPFTILNGKYIVGKVIGEGGSGITYLGTDMNLSMLVAIREFHPDSLVNRKIQSANKVTFNTGSDQENIKRWKKNFEEEAQMYLKFSEFGGMQRVIDCFEENNTSYVVLEYLEGISLKTYLKQKGGKIPVQELLRLIQPVIQFLSEFHAAGYIHLGISPNEMIITNSGQMKLCCYGVGTCCKVSDRNGISILLAPGYTPEEGYRIKGHQGPWSEVYALCGTIYKCITGKTPPEALERGKNDTLLPPSSYGIQISPQQEQAIMEGLAVYAENRIKDMDELHQKLYGVPYEKCLQKSN